MTGGSTGPSELLTLIEFTVRVEPIGRNRRQTVAGAVIADFVANLLPCAGVDEARATPAGSGP